MVHVTTDLLDGRSSSDPPSIAVAICAYTLDRWSQILDAIESTKQQSEPASEILLVVDHNAALLERALTELEDVTVLENTGAPGLSAARNVAASTTSADVLAFLDDDAVAPPNWLAVLVGHFDDPSVAVAGTSVEPNFARGTRPRWFPEALDWVIGCTYEGMSDGVSDVRNVIGASMAVRVSVFRQIGGCSSDMGHTATAPRGGEETDLCLRVQRNDPTARIILDPRTSVSHWVPPSRTTWKYLGTRCFHEGVTKACVAVEQTTALGPEMNFARRTVPRAIGRSIASGLRGRPAELGQIAALAVAIGAGGAGFVTAMSGLGESGERRRAVAENSETAMSETGTSEAAARGPLAAARTPIWVGETEIGDGVRTVTLPSSFGIDWTEARLLIRDHDEALGLVRCQVDQGAVGEAELRRAIESQLTKRAGRSETAPGMVPRQPGVSVILCTRDRPEQVVDAIEDLLALDYENFEIVVVDNSTESEETTRLVERLWGESSRVRCVREREPGLSRARNTGVRRAIHDIVAFTDDDIAVSARWLRRLVAGFERADGVVAVTGSVLPRRLTTDAQLLFENLYGYSARAGFVPRLFDLEAHPVESPLWPFVPGTIGGGGNSAYRRDVYLDSGGCHEALGAGTPSGGGEDLDLFCRLIRDGGVISFEPSAVVWHDHRDSDEDLLQQIEAYGVGLSAYLTKQLLDPAVRGDVCRRVPRGVFQFIQPGGNKTQRDDVPAAVRRAAMRGRLRGPLAYGRALRQMQRSAGHT